MPRSTTEIANAIMTPKDERMSRSTMARAKPFVVSNVATKRYAPATRTTPVKRLPPIPRPTSTKERLSVPRAAPTKQTPRPGSLPIVVPKAEPRRPLPKPIPMPAPNKTSKVQRSLPLLLVPSADRSLPTKTFVPKPLNIVQRLKEGKLMSGCPTSVRSTQVTTANELPPRPSCVPRTRTYRSSVGVMAASKGKQDVTVKVSATGPRNPGIARQKPSVNIGTAKTMGRVKVAETSVKRPVVAGGCRTGAPTRDRRLTPPKPIACAYAVEPAWSPPASPDLSSFPSQSWTIVVDVDVKQIKTPTSMCGNGTLSGMCDTPKSGVAGTPKGSCGCSESVSSSPTLSSSPTVVETPASPAEPMVGSDGTVKISTPTKEPSAEVSHMVCAATIISPSRNGITSSMASLAKVMDRSQASSPTKVSDTGNRSRMTVRCAVEMARTFFSPSRRASQSGTETAASKTMGTDVSRIRKLFIPPLDKDAKASKNPATQIEIEMLRARRKVAGGGVVDPRLDRLGSLAAMAIVTKLGTSSSDGPSQV